MPVEDRNRHWGVYKDGDAVVHKGRNAHVVAVPKSIVPAGHVPVIYDDESGCFVKLHADDLSHR